MNVLSMSMMVNYQRTQEALEKEIQLLKEQSKYNSISN